MCVLLYYLPIFVSQQKKLCSRRFVVRLHAASQPSNFGILGFEQRHVTGQRDACTPQLYLASHILITDIGEVADVCYMLTEHSAILILDI